MNELFSFQVSAVVLMDYDEGRNIRLLSLGKFSINLFMHLTYPILVAFCSVGGFQWPLAKDIVVIRMAKRTFAIALPGLLYGLQFPKCCSDALIDYLIKVFEQHSHYKDINNNNQGYPVKDDEPKMWNMLRPQIEPVAHEALKKLGQLPGISRFHIPNKNSCYIRATRMSAITKFIVESMNTGILKNTQFKITGAHPHNQAYPGRAYASMTTFSWIVDTVELAWLLSSGFSHMLRDSAKPVDACDLGFKVWCLNEDGVVALLKRLEPNVDMLKVKEEVESPTSANDKGKQIIP
ncbi:hypothetical protein SESBI_36284 [Sesbania bispinosa]|nr:hypothetical protein SESBI_36284 [Sesbania bispinosa]